MMKLSQLTAMGNLIAEESAFKLDGYPGLDIYLQPSGGRKTTIVRIRVDQSEENRPPVLRLTVWNPEEDKLLFTREFPMEAFK